MQIFVLIMCLIFTQAFLLGDNHGLSGKPTAIRIRSYVHDCVGNLRDSRGMQ